MIGANSAQIASAARSGSLAAGVVALAIEHRGRTAVVRDCLLSHRRLRNRSFSHYRGPEEATCPPRLWFAGTDPTQQQLSSGAERLATNSYPILRLRPALRHSRWPPVGSSAPWPGSVAEARESTKSLTWASLDPAAHRDLRHHQPRPQRPLCRNRNHDRAYLSADTDVAPSSQPFGSRTNEHLRSVNMPHKGDH